ncbi:MAG: molybdenum cofactor guanylyltransferase [Actinomycetota bacterium]
MTADLDDHPQDGPPDRPVIGAVLCGGRSSRFGSDKALAPLGQGTVGGSVVAALRQGGADPVVAIGGSAGPALDIPTIPDLRPGDGPLAGLVTALLWARTGPVLVVPCDLPLLRGPHVAAILDGLRAAQAPARSTEVEEPVAVVATIGGEPQISLAAWPAEIGRPLLRAIDGGTRAFRAALDHVAWVGIEVPATALTDTDTPEDLARLLRKRTDD